MLGVGAKYKHTTTLYWGYGQPLSLDRAESNKIENETSANTKRRKKRTMGGSYYDLDDILADAQVS
jgi:hypothetical protein